MIADRAGDGAFRFTRYAPAIARGAGTVQGLAHAESLSRSYCVLGLAQSLALVLIAGLGRLPVCGGATMRARFVAGFCAIAVLSAAAEAKGPLNMWFYGSPAEASEKLALSCADREATVIEQDDRHVLCERENSSIAARYLFSGRGGTAPILKVRFTLLKDGKDTRVQAAQWMEVQSALGQERRSELDDAKHDGAMRDLLHDIGAHDFPSSSAEMSEEPQTIGSAKQ